MTDKKRRKNQWIANLIIAFLIWGVILYVYLNEKGYFPKAGAGDPAPGFTLPTLGGGKISLDDYKGKVVLINIWVTWCAPCREEMPSLERLYRILRGRAFEILAVSADEDEEVVDRFVNELELTFPILLDPKEDVAKAYGITGFPETFIIDKKGIIKEKFIGPRNWDSYQNISFIEELLL